MSDTQVETPEGLWKPGALFHAFSRYPRQPDAPRIDRLAGILRRGILAPASCDEGTVLSDLHLSVIGTPVPYDSLVFLHRFGPQSAIYTISEPGRCAVFVDPELAVLTPGDMGSDWVILSQDEVYVRDKVAAEKLIGLAVHPEDVDSVVDEFRPDLESLGIPVYLYHGGVVWP